MDLLDGLLAALLASGRRGTPAFTESEAETNLPIFSTDQPSTKFFDRADTAQAVWQRFGLAIAGLD